MESTRQDRALEIFFRALRGEDITVRGLANEYTRIITLIIVPLNRSPRGVRTAISSIRPSVRKGM